MPTAENGARMVAKSVRIGGRVQGVSFRVWTKGEAEKLSLRGWVCNEPDGSVSALIAGPEASVAAMLERFRSGPRGAVVVSVAVQDADASGVPAGFRITG